MGAESPYWPPRDIGSGGAYIPSNGAVPASIQAGQITVSSLVVTNKIQFYDNDDLARVCGQIKGEYPYGVSLCKDDGVRQMSVRNRTDNGFFNSSGTAKATVSGAKGGNAALGSLLTTLVNYGLITDTTTA